MLLVKRRYEPLAGQWSLPGGAVEVGETLEACVAREMLEETGLEVEVGPVIEVFDRITHDDEGRVQYHFVLVDYLCWPTGGALCAGSDVAEAVFADPRDLVQLRSDVEGDLRRRTRTRTRSPDARSAVMTHPSRDEAWALLVEWTKSESLRKHALAVEAAVRGYARTFGENEDDWGVVALCTTSTTSGIPRPPIIPFRGCEELRRRGYPEWVMRAILSHANYSGVPRESLLEKTLFACDEMAGFVTAAALVRPAKSVLDLEAPLGDQADEGQGVRTRRVAGMTCAPAREALGLPLEEHAGNVIRFMREKADAPRALRGTF